MVEWDDWDFRIGTIANSRVPAGGSHTFIDDLIDDYAKDGAPGNTDFHVVFTLILCGPTSVSGNL